MSAQHTRFLYTNDRKTYFRFLTFMQAKSDMSIYCWWPDIGSSDRIVLKMENGTPVFSPHPISAETQKVSFHGSGMTYMSRERTGQKIPTGQPLFIREHNQIFPKHLCTFFPSKAALTDSILDKPINTRDVTLGSDKHSPFIILLFAIPQTKDGLQIHVTGMFPQDLIGGPISEFLDFGKISLQNHDIIWIGYKPPQLTWPKRSLIAYEDGLSVPVFHPLSSDPINKRASMKIIYTRPVYQYANNHLHIAIPFTDSIE